MRALAGAIIVVAGLAFILTMIVIQSTATAAWVLIPGFVIFCGLVAIVQPPMEPPK